jgi:hypothetical protein
MSENDAHFLSWQGAVTGPHPLEQIRAMLRDGRVHSLYRIQVEGEWVLLRDHLARVSRSARAVVAPPRPEPVAPGLQAVGGRDFPDARWVGENPHRSYDESPWSGDPNGPADDRSVQMGQAGLSGGSEGGGAKGFAITAFVLSLLFFIPVVNLVAWVLALIFGHLALGEQRSGKPIRQAWMAWFGVWMTYIMGGIFLFYAILLALAKNSLPGGLHQSMLLYLNVTLFSLAIVAAINGGLLVWAVRMLVGEVPGFARCYIAALLSLAAGSFAAGLAMGWFGFMMPEVDGSFILMVVAAIVAYWGVQTSIWSEMVKRRDGESLGFGNAALASLFSIMLLGFLYLILHLLSL